MRRLDEVFPDHQQRRAEAWARVMVILERLPVDSLEALADGLEGKPDPTEHELRLVHDPE